VELHFKVTEEVEEEVVEWEADLRSMKMKLNKSKLHRRGERAMISILWEMKHFNLARIVT